MTKNNRARRTAGAALLTSVVAGTGLLTGGAAAASATPANGSCEATALHVSVLGAAAITANRAGSTAACAYDNGVLDVAAAGLVSAQAIEAGTTVTGRSSATSRAALAGLDVGTGTVSDTLTDLLTSGPTTIAGQLDAALAPLLGPSGAVTTAVAPLSGLGLTVAGVNSQTLLGHAKVDLPAALASSLPHVATAGLIQSTASATCATAGATLTGSTTLTDVSVLGTAIDANSTVARTISLDSQALSLADLVSVDDVLRSIDVQVAPASVLSLAVGAGPHTLHDVLTAPAGGLLGAVNAALPVGTTVSSILGAVNPATQTLISGTEVNLPAGVLAATVTPRSESNDGTHLTETALSLSVMALGRPVLSGEVAQARVSVGTVDCSVAPPAVTPSPTPTPTPKPTSQPPFLRFGDPTDPSSDPKFPSGFAERALQCDDARLRLLEVRRSGGKTLVQGVAEKRYVGATATIFLKTGTRKVGTARVQANGTFSTKVALPASAIRNTSKARYYAVVSGDKTTSLKFARRMFVTKLAETGGKVTFSGRMTLPRATRQKAVKIQERVTCSTYKTVASVKPGRSGRFSVTFKAPSGLSSGVYRAFTQVPTSAPSRKLQPTYTLPRILSFTRETRV